MEIIYVLLSAAKVAQLQAALASEHALNFPGCLLSVTWNVARTQALVKAGVRSAVMDQLRLKLNYPWWDKTNHDEIFTWFYSPEWQPAAA